MWVYFLTINNILPCITTLFLKKIRLILVIWSFGKCKSWDPKNATWKRTLWRFHEESFHAGGVCIKSRSHDNVSKQKWCRLVFYLRVSAYFQKDLRFQWLVWSIVLIFCNRYVSFRHCIFFLIYMYIFLLILERERER